MLSPETTSNSNEQTKADKLQSIFASLRFRLILPVIMAGIPAFGLILSNYLTEHQKNLAEAKKDVLQLTQLAFQKEQKFLEGGRQLLITLAKLPQIRNFNSKDCNALLSDLKKEYSVYDNFGVVDLEGNVSCSAIPLKRKVNVADRAWFRGVIQTKDFWVGNYQISRFNKQTNFNLGYPVRDNQNKLSRVVFISIDLRQLNLLAAIERLPVGATYTIADRNGTILAHYPNSEKWIGRSASPIRAIDTIMQHKGQGIFETVGLDGVPRLYAFVPLTIQKGKLPADASLVNASPLSPVSPQLGRVGGQNNRESANSQSAAAIYITVSVPKKIAFDAADRALILNLTWLGLVSSLGLTVAWIGSNLFVVRSVKSLILAAKQVLDSDPSSRNRFRGRGVLRQLNLAFEGMAVYLERSLRERDEAIETLRKKEKRYRAIVNCLKEVIFQSDPNGNWTFLNPAWCDITGFTIAESIGKNFLEFVYPDDRQRSLEEFEQLIQRQTDYCLIEVRSLTKKGEYRWLEVHVQPTFTPDGTIAGTCGTLKDISDRKQSQEALQQSYNLLSAIIEGTSEAIFVKNIQGQYVLANSTTARINGRSISEIIGKKDTDILPEDTARQLMENDRRIINNGQTETIEETTIIHGIERTYLSAKHLWRDYQGNIIGTIGISKDITDRKQMEEELRQQQQRYEMAVSAGKVGVWDWNLQTNEIYIDPSLKAILGYKDKEIRNHIDDWVSHVHPDDLSQVMLVAQANLDGLTPQYKIQHRMVHKDGSNRWFLACGVTIRDANGKAIRMMGTDTDITESKQAEEALQKSEQRFRSLIENSSDIIFIVDRNIVYHYFSPSIERILGYAPQDLLGKNGFDFIHPEDISLVLAGFDRAFQNPKVSQKITDYRIRHRNGSWRIFEASITNLLDDPAIEGLIGNCHDITDRQQAEEALRESERRYHTLAKLSPVGIFRSDAMGKCLYVNERWCEMSGLSLHEALEDGWVQAIHPEDRERIFLLWYQSTKENWPFQSEYRFQRPDGTITWVFGQSNAEIGLHGEIMGYVGTVVDITKRKQTEELLRHYAFYDPLTGLPNRTLFLEKTKQTIAKTKRDRVGLFAVLLLDLDRFQMVKSSLGHLVADRLLIDTSARILSCLDLTDVAARVGLDEFAILLADLQEHTHATRIAERIYQELCVPFILEGQEVFITASIGIALSTIGYERAEDFLRAADMAMHQAKKHGKAGYAVFEPGWHDGAVQRLQLEADLRRAIEREELRVFYQPIVSLKKGNIIGFEALVRWQHPTRGMVPPINFIPLAEETGLIGQIDRWVMWEACRQMAAWQQQFPDLKPLTMSVNLSGFQLVQIGLIERIDRILRETGIERESLKLEITESSLLGNPSSEKAMLEQLKGLDIQLLIDDFGTGYSSLARLHQLPIDTLKIDRSFVSQMSVDSESLEIVRTIISLAHILEMDVIAEGVETADQLAKLRELECEYAQGYFISKPVDSQVAGNLLAKNLIF